MGAGSEWLINIGIAFLFVLGVAFLLWLAVFIWKKANEPRI